MDLQCENNGVQMVCLYQNVLKTGTSWDSHMTQNTLENVETFMHEKMANERIVSTY